ncbi:MAG TPA: hypothetical protein VF545_09345 [Thermoleophilaceae bacterium]
MALATAGCGNLSRGELERGVATLEATASEGVLLAREVARDRTKATYARVHARNLADDAEHEAEKLNDATASTGIDGERRRAAELAGELGDTLGELETAPGDEAGAARAADDLRKQRSELADLLGEL